MAASSILFIDRHVWNESFSLEDNSSDGDFPSRFPRTSRKGPLVLFLCFVLIFAVVAVCYSSLWLYMLAFCTYCITVPVARASPFPETRRAYPLEILFVNPSPTLKASFDLQYLETGARGVQALLNT